MYNLAKNLFALLLVTTMSACTWSLEPLPKSTPVVEVRGIKPQVQGKLRMAFEGQHEKLFKEVWWAECERSPLKWDEGSKELLKIKLISYSFEAEDSLDLIPGVIFPGLVPFGPLAFWWTYEDLSVNTPSVTIKLLAEYQGKGQNSTLTKASGKYSEIEVNVHSTLGITTEDNLARNAFSLASVKVLEWIENNKK
jgi:hypothetical protein